MTEALALLLGLAAGVTIMILIYGERDHRRFTDYLRQMAEPDRPANDASGADERARRSGL